MILILLSNNSISTRQPVTTEPTSTFLGLPSARIEAAADLTRVAGVRVAFGKDHSLWLYNQSGCELVVPAGELCGFNTGTYQEVPSGQSCQTMCLLGCVWCIILVSCKRGEIS